MIWRLDFLAENIKIPKQTMHIHVPLFLGGGTSQIIYIFLHLIILNHIICIYPYVLCSIYLYIQYIQGQVNCFRNESIDASMNKYGLVSKNQGFSLKAPPKSKGFHLLGGGSFLLGGGVGSLVSRDINID